jgi:hypothetical protein
MMNFNKFFLALAFLGGSAAAQAADSGDDFARLPLNKAGERIDRFGERSGQHDGNVWTQSLSQQGDGHPLPDRLYFCGAYANLSATCNGARVTPGQFDIRQVTPAVAQARASTAPDWKPMPRAFV